jgi:2-desacetyl-2-hydroxyethyl bacteriochlorophyllide A dehydrogenase
MRQVVLQQPGEFHLRQVPDPVPAEGDALVRIRRIGICGTDLHAFAGRQPFFSYPRVLGHELSATIEALPRGSGSDAASALRVGDTCVVRPFLNNPESRATRRGRPNCCENLRVLGVHVDGGMGDLLSIRPEFLHPVTDAELDVLALVEPLSIGCHAVARAALTKNDDVLVIGAGPIGLATLQFAALDAGRVTVVDLSRTRLGFVESQFILADRSSTAQPSRLAAPTNAGASEILAAPGTGSGDFCDVEVATEVPAGVRYDVVFDATGSAGSMMKSFDHVAAGGRLVFVGLTLEPITFADPELHRREITLMASRNATPTDFARVLATIRSGHARPGAWITHRLSLDDIPSQFATVRNDPSLIKAIVHVS